MLKNLVLQIYSLLCCFVSVIIITIYSSMFISGIIDISFTEKKFSHSLMKYESNESYFRSVMNSTNEDIEYIKSLSDEEITKIRNQEKEDFIRLKKLSAKSDIISLLPWIFISSIVFIFHWILNKRIISSEN